MKTFPLLLTILTRGQREPGLYKELHKALYKEEEEGETGHSSSHLLQTQCWSLLLGRGGSRGSKTILATTFSVFLLPEQSH